MIIENPVPWWGNFFLLWFFLAWLVRTIVLPYLISKRTNRQFRYAVILNEERATFTQHEKNLLFLVHILALAGFATFLSAVGVMFYNIYKAGGFA